MFFNDQFKPDLNSSMVFPVAYSPNTKATILKTMANAITAGKNGYAYIYFSNESDEMVYFDNFNVSHELSSLRSEDHYYPFGLVMSGISSKALGKLENKIKFTGQELDGELGLDWYQFRYRTMDPEIGRFLQIDPLADRYVYNSTYAYAENDVINSIDLEGLERSPVRYLSPSTNFAQNKRMYREVNSYVPRASQYRNSATYIPNQASSSAPIPANIYEPFEPGTGQRNVGPFITRGNRVGKLGTVLTELIDDLKGQIDRVTVTTDKKVTGVTSSVMSENVKIQWKTQEAEKSFNGLQADYDQQLQTINDNNKLPAPPGAGASQQDWDNWLSESNSIMQKAEVQKSLLGPSPTEQILRSVQKPGEYMRTNTERSTLPSISQWNK